MTTIAALLKPPPVQPARFPGVKPAPLITARQRLDAALRDAEREYNANPDSEYYEGARDSLKLAIAVVNAA